MKGNNQELLVKMNKWKTYKLGEIVDVLGDGIHGTPIYNEVGDYYFINGNNLGEGYIKIKENTLKVDEKEYLKHKKNLTNRTLLLSINGTLGNVAKYRGEPCILGKSACYLNISESCERDFIYYIMISPLFRRDLENMATGTTIKNVSLKALRNYEISLPPLAEQKRIADILSAIDDKIELNRRINANLEQQAQALYKEWFVAVEKDNWEEKRLGDIIELYDSQRRPLSGQQRANMDKIYPYYGAASLMDYVDNYLFDGIYLLLGEDGTVSDSEGFPMLQYVWGKFWVNNHAHILQGKNGYTTESLYILLKQTNVSSIITGAVQPKISQANLKSIPIKLPPIELLSNYNKIIKPLFEEIRNNSTQINQLSTLRDTLLPKLMSGEIKI